VPREHSAKKNGEQLLLSWYFKNYEPNTDLKIFGGNIEIPENPIVIADPIDKLINSNKRRFINVSSCSLRYLRNKILASHGYPFKNPYIRALFYYPSSPFKEDLSYGINKLTSDELNFLKYLTKIENWQHRLSRQRKKGILSYEVADKKDGNRYTFESSYLKPLIADPNQQFFVALDCNHLLILSYPQAIPLKQIKLPLKSQLGVPSPKDIQPAISPDSKYLACGYHQYIGNVGDHRILIIDIKNGQVLHNISVNVHESKERIAFDQNSSTLFTIEAAYDIATGKKIKKWILPDIPGVDNDMDSFQ
jgi:hypothetical protein